nr:GcrA family cell cycle regulator [Hyphomonas sp. Mor2]
MSKSKPKTRSKRVLETRKATGAAAVYALRDSHCKWPVGEPGKAGFHFCGKPSVEGSPYCEAHQQVSLRA